MRQGAVWTGAQCGRPLLHYAEFMWGGGKGHRRFTPADRTIYQEARKVRGPWKNP